MLTKLQTAKYWRTWAALCRAQGWDKSNDARYEFHERIKVPQSMTLFRNRDFNKFLAAAEPLLGNVDIRDRDRENAEHTIQKLREAIIDLLGVEPGTNYLRAIIINLAGDTYDLSRVPLESANKRDLQNISRTLKNRLSRLITKLKNGDINSPMADLWPLFLPNNEIISRLISNRPQRVASKPKTRTPEPVRENCPF